jgi:hypothetical protein
VRAGRSFGMILNAEDRMITMAKAFERPVIQIAVGNLDLVQIQGIGIDRESVVMRSDFNLSGECI